MPLLLSSGLFRVRGLTATFDKTMSLEISISFNDLIGVVLRNTNLESVFTAEALFAVVARKRLHGQMYTFVTLQIVITTEALWALVALERSIRLGMVE